MCESRLDLQRALGQSLCQGGGGGGGLSLSGQFSLSLTQHSILQSSCGPPTTNELYQALPLNTNTL